MTNNPQLDALMKVIDKGINLMPKINQYTDASARDLLNSWQDYAKSVVKLVSERYGHQIYLNYLDLLMQLVPHTPYDQIRQSVSWLLELSKQLSSSWR